MKIKITLSPSTDFVNPIFNIHETSRIIDITEDLLLEDNEWASLSETQKAELIESEILRQITWTIEYA